MQEAAAHAHLKRLLRQQGEPRWAHHLTLSRLAARSLRRGDHTLVTIAPGSDPSWMLGLLVPMALSGRGTALVLSDRLRRRLLQVEAVQIASAGLPMACWEGRTPPGDEQCWLLSHQECLAAASAGDLADRPLVIPEGEELVSSLRQAMTLTLAAADWERLRRAHPAAGSDLLELHERLTRRVLPAGGAPGGSERVMLRPEESEPLRRRLAGLEDLPEPWQRWLSLPTGSWTSWASVDRPMLQWQWHHQPLEPLQACAPLFHRRGVIVADSSGLGEPAGLSDGHPAGFAATVRVQLGTPALHDPLPLYLPRQQPLPNGPAYPSHLADACRKLILGRGGLTVVVLDDADLRRRLLSELAADFGRRVVLEETAPDSNGVLCCGWSWWIEHQNRLPVPDQLVVALLPIASLEDPLTAARVEACKRNGNDWFRSLLLPEALATLQRGTLALRGREDARLAILDGRVRARSWGREVLRALEPWQPLLRLRPR
ncbi:helicase [Synechococcus sp. RSCCF101]|uniref:helicase n=1 Tax=Synechococcus sp. RSCCF101 TaxID=2511069 RepID=UPI0012456B76|nr:helicase [Synechococcus sp. RSCCF101]QEY32163.1 helicase [Synechococcus sp. RSCCF101]